MKNKKTLSLLLAVSMLSASAASAFAAEAETVSAPKSNISITTSVNGVGTVTTIDGETVTTEKITDASIELSPIEIPVLGSTITITPSATAPDSAEDKSEADDTSDKADAEKESDTDSETEDIIVNELKSSLEDSYLFKAIKAFVLEILDSYFAEKSITTETTVK